MSNRTALQDLLAEAQTYSLRAAKTTSEDEAGALAEAVYAALSEPDVVGLADAEAEGAFLRFRRYVATRRWSDAGELALVLIPLLINAATSEER
jgi:hypothetical protein